MASQSSNAIEFSFDSPRVSPTEEMLQAAVAGVGAVADDTPAVEPAVSQAKPAVDATAEVVEEPAVAAVAETEAAQPIKTHKIKVDGQELEVTEADLLSGHMRLKDYTQKTQRLADREREFAGREQEYQRNLQVAQQELQAIDQFLQNQQAMDAYYQKAFGQAQAASLQAIDPNTPVTAAQVNEIARANAVQVQQQMSREIQAAQARAAQAEQKVEYAQRAAAYNALESQVRSHIASLVEQYPILKKFESIDDELMGDAARFQPRSFDEAKERLKEAAERKVATIRSIALDEQKVAAIAAAKLKKTSPEPAGGSPAKQAPGKKLSMDHKDRNARIEAGVADLQAFLNANG